jgi:hypothetical protein
MENNQTGKYQKESVDKSLNLLKKRFLNRGSDSSSSSSSTSSDTSTSSSDSSTSSSDTYSIYSTDSTDYLVQML